MVRMFRLLAVATLAVAFYLVPGAADAKALCGAVVNGKPQPKCAAKPAFYAGAAGRGCPAGSVLDVGLLSCWQCPTGYGRNHYAVDSAKACEKKKDVPDSSRWTKSEYRSGICPAGSFFDSIRGGECWKCPAGYEKAVVPHVEASNKCFIKARQDFAAATWIAPGGGITGLKCPSGQSVGIKAIGTSYGPAWKKPWCGTCPANYVMDGLADSDGPKKCVHNIAEKTSYATNSGKSGCKAGEFEDIGRQECWKCPATYDRTVFRVDGVLACEKVPELDYQRAVKSNPVFCEPGQEYDVFAGVSVTELAELKRKGLASPNAKETLAGNGGCWTCPPYYSRSTKGVKGGDACEAQSIAWQTPEYKEPGMFGLKGAEEVLLEIVRNRQDAVAEAVKAAASAKTDAAYRAAFDQFKSSPESTPAAIALVLGRVLAAAVEPNKASAGEKQLVESFKAEIVKRRTYIANDALDAYKAWKVTTDYYQAKRNEKSGLAALASYGPEPPDFTRLAQLGLIGWGGAATAASLIPKVGDALSTVLTGAGYFQVSGYTAAGAGAGKTAAEALLAVAAEAAVKRMVTAGAEKTVLQAVGTIASFSARETAGRATALAAGAGPGLILSASFIIGSIALDQVIAIDTAEGNLKTAVITAKRHPELKRLATTEAGLIELTGYWTNAATGLAKPSPTFKANFDKAVAALSQSGAAQVQWKQIPGEARAVAVGADGSVWHIGMGKVPGGYGIYRWDKTRWTNVPGGAVRIAVDPKGNALVANDKGNMFRYNGKGWDGIPGEALDIAVGANGSVWHIGMGKVPGGYGIYRWDKDKWTNVPGGAVRIAVDPKGNAWVVNDKGKMFRYNGRGWDGIPGEARAIGIGANGLVWHVGMGKVTDGYGIYWWNDKSRKWTNAPGALVDIAVAPDGKPLGINDKTKMWALQ